MAAVSETQIDALADHLVRGLIARGVAHELSADVRLDYQVTGVVCEIDAPLG